MLTKVRIEVEEQTVGEVVDALTRYEAAITTAEAQRYDAQWPHEYTSDPLQPGVPRRVYPEPSFHWDLVEIPEYDFQLGRELVEEVIEFDSGLPGWKGRRVVRYRRLDGRENDFVPLKEIEEFGVLEGGGFTVTGRGIASGQGGAAFRLTKVSGVPGAEVDETSLTGDDPEEPQNNWQNT